MNPTSAATRITGSAAMPTGIAAASRPPSAPPALVRTGPSVGTSELKPRMSGPKFVPTSASIPPNSFSFSCACAPNEESS